MIGAIFEGVRTEVKLRKFNIQLFREYSMNSKYKCLNLNLKTEQSQKLDMTNPFFQGIPSTIQKINFESRSALQKTTSIRKNDQSICNFSDRINKITSLQCANSSEVMESAERTESSHAWLQTLKKLKEQRQQLIQKRTAKKTSRTRHFHQHQNKMSLASQRVNNICKNVTDKLKRNNIYSQPIREQMFNQFFQQIQRNGVTIREGVLNIFQLFGTLVIILLLFSQTFTIVYPQLQNLPIILIIQINGLIFFIMQTILNFLLVKKKEGKKITKLKDIANQYLTTYFTIDLFTIIVLVLQFAYNSTVCQVFLFFLVALKLPYVFQKLTKFERVIVSSFYYQRYWSLFKIVLFNFAFAHFIAILLNLMAETNQNATNWQAVKGIQNAQWYQKYVWSYYWATTIMLTVGFGDMIPSTYHQAIWIIFIQIVSCIAFSYNISCLGSIIGSIRAQGEEIQKNRKIFQNISRNDGLSEVLVEKVQSYIDESVKLRNKFNIEEQKIFINNLPSGFKDEVICQANKNMLMKLNFFGSLLQKSIYKLSQKIIRRMYHPDQIIRQYNSPLKILILREGEIGYTCRHKPSWLPVNFIQINKKQSPFLMTLQFITKKQPNYLIKTLTYSIIHEMDQSSFVQTLKNISKDYQYYSFLKDKSKHIIDQFQTVHCSSCTTKHTLCDCPKYHFIPIKEHTVQKYLAMLKKSKNNRLKYSKRNNYSDCALKIMRKCNQSLELRKQMALPYIIHQQKNQLMFIDSISKKAFNQQFTTVKSSQNTINKVQGQQFLRIANQMIKDAISSEFKHKQQEDHVWDLTADMVWNYDMYFPHDNSTNLELKFSVNSRLQKWQKYQSLLSFAKPTTQTNQAKCD